MFEWVFNAMKELARIFKSLLNGVLLFLPIQWGEVAGDSMSPTYKNGEWFFSTPIIPRLRVGDVIMFINPMSRAINIKRVTQIEWSRATGKPIIFVEGDNAEHSYDSRDYGFFSMKYVRGRLFDQRPKK